MHFGVIKVLRKSGSRFPGYWGSGGEAPSRWKSFAIFWQNYSFLEAFYCKFQALNIPHDYRMYSDKSSTVGKCILAKRDIHADIDNALRNQLLLGAGYCGHGFESVS